MSDSEDQNITLDVEEDEDTTAAEEEAARKAAEEEAARKAAEEEAARKAAEEEAARKAAEEEEKEMEEQVAEINRLRTINNQRWQAGLDNGFEQEMSHTEQGVLKFEMTERSKVHTNFMNTLLTEGVSGFTPRPLLQSQDTKATSRITKSNINRRGMMFGGFKF